VSVTRRHAGWLVAGLVVCGWFAWAWGGAAARAQEVPPPGAVRWEYRLLTWQSEDTTRILRQIKGDTLGDPQTLARELSRDRELRDDPEIQALVEQRLAERLNEVGQEGWEAYWIVDQTTSVGGGLFPTPTAYLKRSRAD
jgi:hypothetical protein